MSLVKTNIVIASILALLLPSTSVLAQDTTSLHLDQSLEILSESIGQENMDYTAMVESNYYYRQHPLNLNKANKETLKNLALLNDISINNLLTHIQQHGPLLTVYELQSIDGFDLATIKRMLPFITVNSEEENNKLKWNEAFANGQHQVNLLWQQVLEKQKGYDTSLKNAYLGSKPRVYLRYQYRYKNNLSWLVLGEKDAGEAFFQGSQKQGFDFYSANLELKNHKHIQSFIVGDYQVSFGQGLMAYSSLAFGKTPDAINIKRNAQGIRANTSVNESMFLRGVAGTVQFGKFSFTSFYSSRKIDATVSTFDTITNTVNEISTLLQNGYHRTAAELLNKGSIHQWISGGNMHYAERNFSFGITALNTQLSAALPVSKEPYKKFGLSGLKNNNIGVNYDYLFRNVNLFGEIAWGSNKGMASVNGLLLSLDKNLSFSFLYRYFQKNYQAMLANPFSESFGASNEQGMYMGMTLRFNDVLNMNAYYDRFAFNWLKYQVNAPSKGNEYLIQLNYAPNKNLEMYLRVRHQEKGQNISSLYSDGITPVVPVNQDNYRFNISYRVSPTLTLRNRLELLNYQKEGNKTEKAYLVYQDIIINEQVKRFSFTLRYALFESDSYNSRIYAFENDLPYSYSISTYYYCGIRSYLMVRYKLRKEMECWIKAGRTLYTNKKIISAGSLDEINGNTKTEIKFLLKIFF